MNTTADNLLKALETNLSRVKALEKNTQEQKAASAKVSLEQINKDALVIKGVKVITARLDNLNMDLLRKNADLLKSQNTSCVIALSSAEQGRVFLVVAVSPDLCAKGLDAGALVREISGSIGGSGGGRKDFAQAGGTKPEGIEAAFEKLKGIVEKTLEGS